MSLLSPPRAIPYDNLIKEAEKESIVIVERALNSLYLAAIHVCGNGKKNPLAYSCEKSSVYCS